MHRQESRFDINGNLVEYSETFNYETIMLYRYLYDVVVYKEYYYNNKLHIREYDTDGYLTFLKMDQYWDRYYYYYTDHSKASYSNNDGVQNDMEFEGDDVNLTNESLIFNFILRSI